MTQTPQPADFTMQRSSRDHQDVAARLARWLAGVLPPGAEPVVDLHSDVEANGLSSETVLLDVTATEQGERATTRYVARVAPAEQDVPVFPSYRLRDQYDAMRLARELAGVPVPELGLIEESGAVLGTPFFLMRYVEGIVPPDVLPYTFGDNWLFDATAEQQRTLQDASVEVLARLHRIPDAATTFGFLDPAVRGHEGATPLARNLASTAAWYDFALTAPESWPRSPLLERALAWLRANLPDTDEAVLVWGDARIGNIMYQDFRPAAVLDWEMVTLGPRQMDVAWLLLAHEVFEEIATSMGCAGMPGFLAEEGVRATYERLSGATLGDLTWYRLYSALIWGCVFMRASARQVRFGEIEVPEDPESVMYHRGLLTRLLEEVGA